ncbi:MAG: SLC13 family permease [candidate division KSB1 bacterium]|nr:SLC13 family permease [candidate division KSB1 bacterium]
MEQILVFITLGTILILFVWGKIRYDLVSMLALVFLVICGVVPASEAFAGFGHPAVITVAAVLIISQALQNSGLVDVIARLLEKLGSNFILQLMVLCSVVAIASSFMNNIGALAILMPVAIHLARKNGYPPSYILMPIAFASLLGGITTLIGTPPNIIAAAFRADVSGEPFGMFDFTPVGFFVVVIGILYITLLGWRLLPTREPQGSAEELFQIQNYLTEVQVTKESKLQGMRVADLRQKTETDILILSLVRNGTHLYAPAPEMELKIDDILLIEAEANDLKKFIDKTKVKLVGSGRSHEQGQGTDDIVIQEAIVQQNSPLIGETAVSLRMRSRFSINLLAIARQDQQLHQRIDHVPFKAGDVLLLQGRRLNIHDAIASMHCLPLAQRGLTIGKPRRTVFALGIFVTAIIMVIADLIPAQIAFSLAAVLMVLSGNLHLNELYDSIDWPVIVLLGAMIPIGVAFETSGGANLITHRIVELGNHLPIWALLGILMTVTILISSLINNAATVVLMAPIGINIARELKVSADPFLMAVAIAASCAFLTPIGHQCNTLVMGPGGYKFSDYWRMGLPLEIIIIAISIPLILIFWPA